MRKHKARVEVGRRQLPGDLAWAAADQYSDISFSAYRARLALLISARDQSNSVLPRAFGHGFRLCALLFNGAVAKRQGPKSGEQLALVKAVEPLITEFGQNPAKLVKESKEVKAILSRARISGINEHERQRGVAFFERVGQFYGDRAEEAFEEAMRSACF